MKSLRTTAAILVALVVLFPAVAPAQTTTPSTNLPLAVQQLIAAYTQLIQLLEQEIGQLTAAQANTPPPTISCPLYNTPNCTGTLVPQGIDSNGCQLPPQCVANTTPFSTANTTPAPTCTLTARPTSVTAGQSTTLSWSATNATAGSISPIGSALSSGSQIVTPSQATDYVGVFSGTGGNAYCTVLVIVVPATIPIVATTTTAGSCVANGTTYINGSDIVLNPPPMTMMLAPIHYQCSNGSVYTYGSPPLCVSGACQTSGGSTTGGSCTAKNGQLIVPEGGTSMLMGTDMCSVASPCPVGLIFPTSPTPYTCQNGKWVTP